MRSEARDGRKAAKTIRRSHCIALVLMLKSRIAKTDGISDLSNNANSGRRLARRPGPWRLTDNDKIKNEGDMTSLSTSVVERRTMSKVTGRLAPFPVFCDFIADLERVNVGFAGAAMSKDLNFSAAAFGAVRPTHRELR